MSNDRPDKPPVDHCPTCWTDGRNTTLHNGSCWLHGTTYPPLVPVPGQRCQIEDCRRNAVAQDCGVYVCEGHMGWKRDKAQPTRVLTIDDAPAQVSDAARLRVAHSLLRHRDALIGDGANVTQLRHDLQTAATMLAPPVLRPAPSVPPAPGLDPATHAHIVEALGTCITRVEDAVRYGSRSYVSEVEGLLVAARAARVALGMQLPSAPTPTLYQLAGFLSADLPELHGVEVPRIAESVERFIKTLI